MIKKDVINESGQFTNAFTLQHIKKDFSEIDFINFDSESVIEFLISKSQPMILRKTVNIIGDGVEHYPYVVVKLYPVALNHYNLFSSYPRLLRFWNVFQKIVFEPRGIALKDWDFINRFPELMPIYNPYHMIRSSTPLPGTFGVITYSIEPIDGEQSLVFLYSQANKHYEKLTNLVKNKHDAWLINAHDSVIRASQNEVQNVFAIGPDLVNEIYNQYQDFAMENSKPVLRISGARLNWAYKKPFKRQWHQALIPTPQSVSEYAGVKKAILPNESIVWARNGNSLQNVRLDADEYLKQQFYDRLKELDLNDTKGGIEFDIQDVDYKVSGQAMDINITSFQSMDNFTEIDYEILKVSDSVRFP